MACNYHLLGKVAEESEDFDSAENLYNQSLEIWLSQSDYYTIAFAYQGLGRIARKRQNFNLAIDFTQRAIDIFYKFKDIYNAEKARDDFHQI